MIPLEATRDLLRDPTALPRLQQQYGGTSSLDRDGSRYGHIGDRPIPPPQAMRSIHAHKADERRQVAEAAEADAAEKEYSMGVKESRTALYFESDTGPQATRQRRELAQRDLDVPLCETAYEYEVRGSGVPECDGAYEYSTASRNGAPVYKNKEGWVLHRDRPQVASTIGTDDEVAQNGWIITRDNRPFYAAKTDSMLAPESGWECFMGPPPPPAHVTGTSWERCLWDACGPLKDAGNLAIQEKDGCGRAADRYSEALGHMEGYDDVVASSEKLQQLRVALYSNRSEARLRMCQWQDAVDDARWVLERDPTHTKAVGRLFRGCKALGRVSDAVGPLRKLLDEAGPKGCPEAKSLLDEGEILESCEQGTSRLTGTYQALTSFQHELESQSQRRQSSGPSEELARKGLALAGLLEKLQDEEFPGDLGLQKEANLLMQATDLLGKLIVVLSQADSVAAVDTDDDSDDVDEDDVGPGAGSTADIARAKARDARRRQRGWGVELLTACVWPQLKEVETRRILAALPAMVPRLLGNSQGALALVRKLLRHRLRQQLKIADVIVEAKGLLFGCLRSWMRLLDDTLHHEEAVIDMVSEVLQGLESQALRLDNVEALALALFVEGFVGQKHEGGVTGGFSQYNGTAARQVVVSMLHRWASDKRVLHSLQPELVGRIWSALAAKLRRDAGVEAEKPVPGKNGMKLEWFKLKPMGMLRYDISAFHPEDMAEAVLVFLRAHLEATCERGCEREVKDGISPRHPAEEWMDDVIDKPFGWGILLPFIIAPPQVAREAFSVLEVLIKKHPHDELLAKRLAGFLVFMPLLSMPWPQKVTVVSHFSATVALHPAVRRSISSLLRCSIDTEMALRVCKDHCNTAVPSIAAYVVGVLEDKDYPESAIEATQALGIILSNFDAWEFVSDSTMVTIVEAFTKSTHKPTRNQLAKFLRLAHSNADAREDLREALEDDRIDFNEEQQARFMQEVFDLGTLAGQEHMHKMIEVAQKEATTPLDMESVPADQELKQAAKALDALTSAVVEAYLKWKPSPRVLVMGRVARPVCRYLGESQKSCTIVLGETTLDKLDSSEPFGQKVRPVLLPAPVAVPDEPELASKELFDLVITAEPMGYFDIGEYAEKLRPFIRRREKDDERQVDQVQWVCIEHKERLEDARDELYSAGYYLADHDKSLDALKKAAKKLDYDVGLLSLPSDEKEQQKKRDHEKALDRQVKRKQDDEAQAVQEDEEEQRRGVLYETLFDPMLSPPEPFPLPVAFEIGCEREVADVVFFWLHGNGQDPEGYRSVLDQLVADVRDLGEGKHLRVVACSLPEGRESWYRWSDEVSVNYGMEFFQMSNGPTDEEIEKAEKEAYKNTSFGRPQFEEMQTVEEIELCVKQLLNLVEEEIAGLRESARVVLGGFSQGGSVAAYASLSHFAPEEVQARLHGLVTCCAGVPVQHFLGPKMQAACLALKDKFISEQPLKIQMIYGKPDTEIKESFVETSRDFYRRFNYPTVLQRFEATPEDRFPEQAQQDKLRKALLTLAK